MSEFGIFSGLYLLVFGLNSDVYKEDLRTTILVRENMDQKKLQIRTRLTLWYKE